MNRNTEILLLVSNPAVKNLPCSSVLSAVHCSSPSTRSRSASHVRHARTAGALRRHLPIQPSGQWGRWIMLRAGRTTWSTQKDAVRAARSAHTKMRYITSCRRAQQMSLWLYSIAVSAVSTRGAIDWFLVYCSKGFEKRLFKTYLWHCGIWKEKYYATYFKIFIAMLFASIHANILLINLLQLLHLNFFV